MVDVACRKCINRCIFQKAIDWGESANGQKHN